MHKGGGAQFLHGHVHEELKFFLTASLLCPGFVPYLCWLLVYRWSERYKDLPRDLRWGAGGGLGPTSGAWEAAHAISPISRKYTTITYD